LTVDKTQRYAASWIQTLKAESSGEQDQPHRGTDAAYYGTEECFVELVDTSAACHGIEEYSVELGDGAGHLVDGIPI
jgi:hypothetical protein